MKMLHLNPNLLLCAVAFSLAACAATPPQEGAGTEMKTEEKASPPKRIGMPNPASVHCEKVGGKLVLQTQQGGVTGMCTLPDGTVCEEWALYRGECPKR